MKKIITILALSFLIINAFGQWSPKPNNPYKWYHIEKDTAIMDIEMSGFDVCIYQGAWKYNQFKVDSLGNVQPPVISATIWFREFSSGTKSKYSVSRPFNDFAVEFYDMPFACEDGELGIRPVINTYLSKKYNVALNKITE